MVEIIQSEQTYAWLEELHIADDLVPGRQEYEPLPAWIRACHDLALNDGTAELSKKFFPVEFADWQRFMLLMRADPASQAAIEALQRIDPGKARAYVHDLKAEVLEKINHAVFASKIRARQGSRERRIDGRIVGGFAGDEPPARPSDEEFIQEALPPKRGQR